MEDHREVVVLSAVRTPIGKYGGGLATAAVLSAGAGGPGRARGRGARGGLAGTGASASQLCRRPLTPGPGGPILPSSTVRAMAWHDRLRTGDPEGRRALGGHGRA
jgi:hypothetical protein